MTRLPHSGMHVPTTRLHITQVRYLAFGGDLSWTAEVQVTGQRIGVLLWPRYGAPAAFQPDTEHAAATMAEFVADCRDRHGQAMAAEDVYEALYQDYDTHQKVRSESRQRRFIIRVYLAHRSEEEFLSFGLVGVRRLDFERAWSVLSEIELPDGTVTAELWTGRSGGWAEYYRAPDADSQ